MVGPKLTIGESNFMVVFNFLDPSSLKRSSPMSGFLDEESSEQKKLRLQSSMRMLKDEPVPEGYMRFR